MSSFYYQLHPSTHPLNLFHLHTTKPCFTKGRLCNHASQLWNLNTLQKHFFWSKQQHFYYFFFSLQNCVQIRLVHRKPPLSIFFIELPEILFSFVMRFDSIVGWYVAVTFSNSTVLSLITEKTDAKALHMLMYIYSWPWLCYLGNKIGCCSVDHWWLLNAEQKWISTIKLVLTKLTFCVWAPNACTVTSLKIPHA